MFNLKLQFSQIIQLIKKYHPTMLVIEHDQRFIDELGAQVIHLT